MRYITLLTDLGSESPSIAGIKSLLGASIAEAQIIDITHEIKPYYLQQASYILSAALQQFQEGTIHLAIFDIQYSREPQMVVVESNGQFIIAPDNGLVPNALRQDEVTGYLVSGNEYPTLRKWIETARNIIQTIISGKGFEDMKEPVLLQSAPLPTKLLLSENYAECPVIHIDRFGNAVLNITRQEFETAKRNRRFHIQLLRDEVIDNISTGYYSVAPGEKLCRFNSAGYLEICINGGSAANLFGLKMMHDAHLISNKIKINFE